MQNASHSTAVWTFMTDLTLRLEQHFETRRLKRGMLAMLAAWLGYFILISMSVRSLNKVVVPLIDMPLGVFLVIQGTAVIFVAALVLLLRSAGIAGATR
jgi:hypothetical protein